MKLSGVTGAMWNGVDWLPSNAIEWEPRRVKISEDWAWLSKNRRLEKGDGDQCWVSALNSLWSNALTVFSHIRIAASHNKQRRALAIHSTCTKTQRSAVQCWIQRKHNSLTHILFLKPWNLTLLILSQITGTYMSMGLESNLFQGFRLIGIK